MTTTTKTKTTKTTAKKTPAKTPAKASKGAYVQTIHGSAPAKSFKQRKALKEAVRPLTDVERQKLVADVQANGVQTPIVVTPDMVVIDGHHRVSIASGLGLDIPFHVSAHSEPQSLAVALNEVRRQMSDEELTLYVHKAVAEGKSTRQIAKETGASKSKVARKAKTSPKKSATVKGRDGRTQKATSSKRQSAAKAKTVKRSKLDTAKASFKALSPEDRAAFMGWAFGQMNGADE